MRVVELAEIRAALDEDAALEAIAEGFRLFSSGRVMSTPVTHLRFVAPGDCHIKAAHIHGDPIFVVKLATGFYENPARGLESSNGLMLLISADTGEPVALLRDEGRLTDLRTALAGAVVARLVAPAARRVGIVGAGIQARLQARSIARMLGGADVDIWARDERKAARLARSLAADGLKTRARSSVAELCGSVEVVVTTTPSPTPLITAEMVAPGAAVIAVGADAPGKQELDPWILHSAAHVIADSRAQCLDHGECAAAVSSGLFDPALLIELGDALSRPERIARGPRDTIVVDLTGLGVQDVQIAKTVWAGLSPQK